MFQKWHSVSFHERSYAFDFKIIITQAIYTFSFTQNQTIYLTRANHKTFLSVIYMRS